MAAWASSLWGVVTTEASYLAEDLGNAAKGATVLFGGGDMPWDRYLNTPELKAALEDKVTERVKMIPKQPGAFLKLAGDKKMMESFEFNWEDWDKVYVDNCMNFDREIEVVGQPIIPSQITEEGFWKNYASHVHVICKTLILEHQRNQSQHRVMEEDKPQQPQPQRPQRPQQPQQQPQQPQQQRQEKSEGRGRGRSRGRGGRGRGRERERREREEEKKKEMGGFDGGFGNEIKRKEAERGMGKGKGRASGGFGGDPEEVEIHDREEEKREREREGERERENKERERKERERKEREKVEKEKAERMKAKRERMERAKREREKARREREEREKEEKMRDQQQKKEREEKERQQREIEKEISETSEGGWMGGWMGGWGDEMGTKTTDERGDGGWNEETQVVDEEPFSPVELDPKTKDLSKFISQFEEEILKELEGSEVIDLSKLDKQLLEETEREMEEILRA